MMGQKQAVIWYIALVAGCGSEPAPEAVNDVSGTSENIVEQAALSIAPAQEKAVSQTHKVEPSPVGASFAQLSSSSLSLNKIDKNGNALPNDALEWVCIYDENTNRYWLNSSEQIPASDSARISAHIQDTNDTKACQKTNWRLPTPLELLSLVIFDQHPPRLDSNFFPNREGKYWSAARNAHNPDYVWCADTQSGKIQTCAAQLPLYVRLISSAI